MCDGDGVGGHERSRLGCQFVCGAVVVSVNVVLFCLIIALVDAPVVVIVDVAVLQSCVLSLVTHTLARLSIDIRWLDFLINNNLTIASCCLSNYSSV